MLSDIPTLGTALQEALEKQKDLVTETVLAVLNEGSKEDVISYIKLNPSLKRGVPYNDLYNSYLVIYQ